MEEKTADIDILEEKEKKAINNLNFIIVTDIYGNEVSIDKTKIINEYNESVGIVLNLVKTLIVENKELKERNKTMLSDEEREALRNFKSEYETCKYNSSDLIIELDDAKILSNLFKNLIAENKELKEKYIRKLIDFQKEREEYEKYYIQKSKVEEEIDKLNKKEKDLQNSISDEEREEYSDANISFDLMDIDIRRETLQSLLGKE